MTQVVISTRVPKEMAENINEVISGRYVNSADFIRDAIRKKIFEIKTEQIRQEYLKAKDSVKAVRNLRKLTGMLGKEEYAKWVEENTKDMP